MRNFDKGTVIRTVLLFIAFVNQTLIMFGHPVVPIDEGQVTTLIEGLYLVGSMLFTLVTTVIAWFKNNYITERGQLQKKALQAQGLIKK
ncbi:phage holin [Sutcliffiella sp. NC1]|uniref:phage holin n=1 Tax=Sutcliffiella sp. NC1 TaxID=3004096 RepID=UPI0022DDE1BF|nr:phage holin [Sutcliffiella sp. NC1]WBL16461.1 phage holin [Sutcliffiella sp. NC1]